MDSKLLPHTENVTRDFIPEARPTWGNTPDRESPQHHPLVVVLASAGDEGIQLLVVGVLYLVRRLALLVVGLPLLLLLLQLPSLLPLHTVHRLRRVL